MLCSLIWSTQTAYRTRTLAKRSRSKDRDLICKVAMAALSSRDDRCRFSRRLKRRHVQMTTSDYENVVVCRVKKEKYFSVV